MVQPCGTHAAYRRGCRCDECRAASAAVSKAYRENNRETVAGRQRAWYERNREAVLQERRTYRERNRETVLQKGRAYRERNRETVLQKGRARYARNPEITLARNRAYLARNREITLARRRQFYALEKSYMEASTSARGAWVPAEDVTALTLSANGYRAVDIAFALDRTAGSVRGRLGRLRKAAA